MEEEAKEPTAEEKQPLLVSFDEFARVELRVAQILEAEAVPKSEKLIKLQVNLGPLGDRQIVAGIGKHYRPEDLVGRKIAVVANLKPAKLMGQLSQGMLLAASDDADINVQLISVGPDMPNGSRIR